MHLFKVENNIVVQEDYTGISLADIRKKYVGDDWRQGTAVCPQIEVNGFFENPPLSNLDIVAALHKGASAHQDKYPTGKADSLIMSNANAGKPKSLENVNWLKALWNEYYIRVDALSLDTDFSIMGDMPNTVRECVEE